MTNTIVLLPDTGSPELIELEGLQDRDAQLCGLMECQPVDVISLTDRPGGLDMWVCEGRGAWSPNLIASAVAARYGSIGSVFGPVVFASTVRDEGAGELPMCGLSQGQLDELVATIEMFRHTYGYYPWKVDR